MTGFPHPDYLAPWLSSAQLLEWDVYSTQHGHRADLQWGLLTNAVCAAAGDKRPLADFLPYQDIEPTPSEVYDKLSSFFPNLRLDNT